MPRYFFNAHIEGRIVADREGEAHPNRDAASQAARAVAQRLLGSEEPGLGTARLVVIETGGDVVLELPFAELRA